MGSQRVEHDRPAHRHTQITIVKVALELGCILQQWCGVDGGASRKDSNISFS